MNADRINMEDFFLVVRECGNGVYCIYIRADHVEHSVDVLRRTGSVYFATEQQQIGSRYLFTTN